MDKKVFLAVALSAAIFLIWQALFLKPYQQQQAPAVAQQQARQQPPAPSEGKAAAVAPQTKGDVKVPQTAKTVQLGDASFSVTVSAQGGTVGSPTIPQFRGTDTKSLALLIGSNGQAEITTPSAEWAYLSTVNYKVVSQAKEADGSDKLVLGYSDANVEMQRSYVVRPKLFSVDQEISATFKKQAPRYLFVGVQAPRDVPKALQENERREVWYSKAGGPEKWGITDVEAGEVKEDLGQGQWMGVSSRYFLNALLDQGALNPKFQARYLNTGEVAANFIYEVPGASVRIPLRQYYGPKDLDILKAAGKNLDSIVDFGWFTIIAYPLLQALNWFYKYVQNYGIAIILLTVLVKILTYPLTAKSMKSMKEMQRIQPQLAALRERYKDDKEKLNREMLQLMRANGYNPMSGCFPIFIQMPIFIALYNVLYGTIDLVGAPFFGWITDLSAKDPYYVTPVLLGLMMFLQQKLTPNTASDPAQQRMMMMMPVIFGFMMLWLPSGLTLYMLINSVVSILQQVWMNRSLGLGKPATA